MSLRTSKIGHICVLASTSYLILGCPHKSFALSLSGVLNDPNVVDYRGIIGSSSSSQYYYEGVVSLYTPNLIPVGGAKQYKEVFKRDFPDPWKFFDSEARDGEYALAGNFQSLAYEKCSTSIGKNCEIPSLTPFGGPSLGIPPLPQSSIGALFIMKYALATGESFSSDMDFVQIVNTSYASAIGCNYPDNAPIVDRLCGATNPYFNNYSGNSNGIFYMDVPFTDRRRTSNVFKAATFFARKGQNNSVTLYDGVSWGWSNNVTRKFIKPNNISSSQPSQSSPFSPLKPPCPAGMPIQSCIAFGYDHGGVSYAQVPIEEIANSQLSFDEPAAAPESVPTPALLPGMIATGIYHGRKWRKRKQQNQNNDSKDIAA
jgi:hypothetical protein